MQDSKVTLPRSSLLPGIAHNHATGLTINLSHNPLQDRGLSLLGAQFASNWAQAFKLILINYKHCLKLRNMEVF